MDKINFTRAIVVKFWGGFVLSHDICCAVHDCPKQVVGLIFTTKKIPSVDLRKFAHVAKLGRLNSVLTLLHLSKLYYPLTDRVRGQHWGNMSRGRGNTDRAQRGPQ